LISIFRYVPSQADVAVFDALKKAPAKDAAPHAARWYAHIASFEAAGRKQFPKSQKDAASYVAGGKEKSF
jgi:elongation factor 1-beta